MELLSFRTRMLFSKKMTRGLSPLRFETGRHHRCLGGPIRTRFSPPSESMPALQWQQVLAEKKFSHKNEFEPKLTCKASRSCIWILSGLIFVGVIVGPVRSTFAQQSPIRLQEIGGDAATVTLRWNSISQATGYLLTRTEPGSVQPSPAHPVPKTMTVRLSSTGAVIPDPAPLT